MKAGEATDGNNKNGDEYDEKYGDHDGYARERSVFFEEHERKRQAEHDEHVNGERDEELQKIAVVASSNAIANPLKKVNKKNFKN